MLKGILFDMGSTLLEFENKTWEDMSREGFQGAYAILRNHGYHLPPFQEMNQVFWSTFNRFWNVSLESLEEVHLNKIFQDVFNQLSLDIEECLYPLLVEAHYKPVSDQVTIYHDTYYTLFTLKEKGLKLAIVSNTVWPAYLHESDLRRFGILDFFDDCVFSSEVEIRKPHPKIFRMTLESLALSPEEAIFVGDRIAEDVMGAQKVGMKGVLRKHRLRPSNGGNIKPDAEIEQLSELFNLLKEWEMG
ncbi:MAG: HAD family hydrolase [Candidatus Tectomicrobia bacterium]|uniref:HAD family hydrolase n=1 Tax=Tectimicrobiota bacterium TaxID=2528274 RepID=A0A933GQ07_UNCTE|nr:HAD family hydrolase [Candidatus Tectomicrobia bacterium]